MFYIVVPRVRRPCRASPSTPQASILHDWSLEKKQMLIRKAYEALPFGGALIVYDPIIDDDRRRNAFGLLMSLNMLIETREGFVFTQPGPKADPSRPASSESAN